MPLPLSSCLLLVIVFLQPLLPMALSNNPLRIPAHHVIRMLLGDFTGYHGLSKLIVFQLDLQVLLVGDIIMRCCRSQHSTIVQ